MHYLVVVGLQQQPGIPGKTRPRNDLYVLYSFIHSLSLSFLFPFYPFCHLLVYRHCKLRIGSGIERDHKSILVRSASDMDMGWVHPWVGLGWVLNFRVSNGLGWVQFLEFIIFFSIAIILLCKSVTVVQYRVNSSAN